MKNLIKFVICFLSVIGLAIFTAFIGKNIYGIFFPSQIGGDLGDIIQPGIIEGFVFMYLFWLALIFIPVFKAKWWQYGLVPGLLMFLPVVLFWPVGFVGLIFFGVGVCLGFLVLWVKKKI